MRRSGFDCTDEISQIKVPSLAQIYHCRFREGEYRNTPLCVFMEGKRERKPRTGYVRPADADVLCPSSWHSSSCSPCYLISANPVSEHPQSAGTISIPINCIFFTFLLSFLSQALLRDSCPCVVLCCVVLYFSLFDRFFLSLTKFLIEYFAAAEPRPAPRERCPSPIEWVQA